MILVSLKRSLIGMHAKRPRTPSERLKRNVREGSVQLKRRRLLS